MSDEPYYRTIVENFPNGMVALFDRELRYTVINGEGLAAIGMSPEALQGMRLRDVFPPDIYRRDEPALLAALAGEKSESFVEFGDEYFRVLTIPVFDADGEVIQGMVVSQNVTALRHAEEQLREANQTLELAVDTASLGMWELDLASEKLTWNQHLHEIYDVTPEEFADDLDGWRERLHPDDREEAERAFASIQTEGSVRDVRFRVVQRDGRVRHVYASGAVRRDETGAPIALVGINLDVTEVVEARAQLETTEARYKRIYDQSLDGLVVIDDDGLVLDCNRAAEALFGRVASALKGEDVWALVAAADDTPSLGPRLAFEGKLGGPVIVRRPDGTTRHAELLAVRDPEAGQHPLSLRDVTEQRELEGERARLDARLRQSQRLESLGKLTGGVAHDLNNLLQVLLSQTEEALETKRAEDRDVALSEALKAIGVAQELVAQLLDFARRDKVRAAPLKLDEAIARSLPLIRPLIEPSVSLHYEAADEEMVILADPVAVEQVLMNLCVNARDAMPSGGTVTLRTRPSKDDDGAWAEVVVSDTGVGIAPEATERIFDPFFTTKELGRGTGLGLATVYGIVKRHGGTILVDSEVGSGTTFTVRWPLSRRAHSAVLSSDSRRGLLVLADDDALVRHSLGRYLEQAGFEVVAVVNGREALEALNDHGSRVSMMVLDIRMPVMDGVTAYRAFRDAWPRLPVLFISGYHEQEMGELLDESVPVRLLEKPFRRDALLETIEDSLIMANAGED